MKEHETTVDLCPKCYSKPPVLPEGFKYIEKLCYRHKPGSTIDEKIKRLVFIND